jgi:hypothetical protein
LLSKVISRGFESVREAFAENFPRRGEFGGGLLRLTGKVSLTDDSGRPTTPKRFAEQQIRFMLGLLEPKWTQTDPVEEFPKTGATVSSTRSLNR